MRTHGRAAHARHAIKQHFLEQRRANALRRARVRKVVGALYDCRARLPARDAGNLRHPYVHMIHIAALPPSPPLWLHLPITFMYYRQPPCIKAYTCCEGSAISARMPYCAGILHSACLCWLPLIILSGTNAPRPAAALALSHACSQYLARRHLVPVLRQQCRSSPTAVPAWQNNSHGCSLMLPPAFSPLVRAKHCLFLRSPSCLGFV